VLTFSIKPSAGSLALGSYVGHVQISSDGNNDPSPLTMRLTVMSGASAHAPVGVIDTPANGQSGITGPMGVTGWAVDEVGVKQVRILRGPATGEGTKPIFLGYADLVEGARPDVAVLYSTRPLNTRAGWGFMILSNFLPRQGNGSYTLYAYADDIDGHSTLLGTRTINCDNAHLILPFGAIDTPSQGGTASGSPFVNFGWVLAGQPASSGRYIPFDGHTIEVFIDSVSIGTLDTYNNARSDIQAYFPGFANTNGAVGAKFFDTTAMANGVHTIGWIAKDDVGHTQGIGSRFFKVFNQSGLYLDAPVPAGAQTAAMPADRATKRLPAAHMLFAGTLVLTRGWSATGQPQFLAPGPGGVYATDVTVGDRIVLDLNPTHEPARFSGRRLNGGTFHRLPFGSSLGAEGYFTWAPAPGFGGVHEFVFRVEREGASSEIRVRVAVRPRITAGGSR
jgi:hypothetical protein